MATRLTEKFNTASVYKGETFEIELGGNAGAAYDWTVEVTEGAADFINRRVLTLGGPRTVGGATRWYFTYKSNTPGEVTFTATYKRVWEKAPAHKATFNVSVR